MKKKNIIIILFLAILLIGAYSLKANFSRPFHHAFTKSTDLSKENIEGSHLDDKINSEKITSKYGEISTLSQDNSAYNYYFLRKGIEIATELDDQKIIRFIIDDEDVKSEKGISIGDNKDKVIDSYGENYYTRLEQGTTIIGYVDKENKTSIEFWIHDDKVDEIRYDYNYMA